MNITVAIPTCIYPRGCKHGVETALAEVEAAHVDAEPWRPKAGDFK